jgi:hypothetical protein
MLVEVVVLNMVLVVVELLMVLVDLVVEEMVVQGWQFLFLDQQVENLEPMRLVEVEVEVLGMDLDHNWEAMVVQVS